MNTQVAVTTFLNVNEAAEFLRIAPKTLYGLVSQRRIPFRKAGRRLLFLQSELLEWTQPAPDRRDAYRHFSPTVTIGPRIVTRGPSGQR